MIGGMRYLTHRWVWKRWAARPDNQNAEGGRSIAFGRYQRLMDRIDPASRRGLLPSALLARTLAGRRRRSAADEVEICLHAFILFVALYAEKHGRSLQTVQGLLADPDTFLGTLIMMTSAREPAAMPLRLFAKRLRLWSDDRRADVAASASRRLAFLPKPRSG